MSIPIIRVGLSSAVAEASFTLDGDFNLQGPASSRTAPPQTRLLARVDADSVSLVDPTTGIIARARKIRLEPKNPSIDTFLLHGFTVGASFHWEHTEDLRFQGSLVLEPRETLKGPVLDVINEIALESYLVSVISSEMSALCPSAMLRAHAIISRSWLLAQMEQKGRKTAPSAFRSQQGTRLEILRWYDREDHATFDVCADDHCQRYQGITRTLHGAATEAVDATRGRVLVHGGQVCDARFSKCCGGMTEVFPSAWEDRDVPYLQAFPDDQASRTFPLPLTEEPKAAGFIEAAPPAFCNTTDQALLTRILPAIDHETRNFYRWEIRLGQDELRHLVSTRLGADPGPVESMKALRRGPSGRIVLLEIRGRDLTLQIGKELEIRRALSTSHLYSSAFNVHPEGQAHGVPEAFRLRGAGWGHGVGLCQIGAAVMAEQGHGHEQILAHYYRGATLEKRYG